MKKMNKIPAIAAAAMMLLGALLYLIPQIRSVGFYIEQQMWYNLIVPFLLLFITRVVYSVGLFLGKKGIPGAVMVGGSGVLYFLVVIIHVLSGSGSPQFLTILHLIVYALLLFVTLDVVKLPKPVGMLLILVPAALVLVLSLVQDIRQIFFQGGRFDGSDFVYGFRIYGRWLLEDILIGGSLILAGIAVSTEPKEKAAPQSYYGQAPYQPAPQAQQYQQVPQYQAPQYQQVPQYQAPQHQAPQYQQPVYARPQYQAPQYQQPQYQAPQYQQPQYQTPQYQQPVYAQPQYQPAPQEAAIPQAPVAPQEEQL